MQPFHDPENCHLDSILLWTWRTHNVLHLICAVLSLLGYISVSSIFSKRLGSILFSSIIFPSASRLVVITFPLNSFHRSSLPFFGLPSPMEPFCHSNNISINSGPGQLLLKRSFVQRLSEKYCAINSTASEILARHTGFPLLYNSFTASTIMTYSLLVRWKRLNVGRFVLPSVSFSKWRGKVFFGIRDMLAPSLTVNPFSSASNERCRSASFLFLALWILIITLEQTHE